MIRSSGKRKVCQGLLATATVGEGGWVDLAEPIIVQAGDGFIAVPDKYSNHESPRSNPCTS